MESKSPFPYADDEVERLFNELTDTLELEQLEQHEPHVAEIFAEASYLNTLLKAPDADDVTTSVVAREVIALNERLGMNGSAVIVSGGVYEQKDESAHVAREMSDEQMEYKGMVLLQPPFFPEVVHWLRMKRSDESQEMVNYFAMADNADAILDFCSMSAERSRAVLANNFPDELYELEQIAVQAESSETAVMACAVHQLPEEMTVPQQAAFIQYAQYCFGFDTTMPHAMCTENTATNRIEEYNVEVKGLTIGYLNTETLSDKPVWQLVVAKQGVYYEQSALAQVDLRYLRDLTPYFPSKKPSLPIQND